ncbi:DUF2336 domain-containing protein [Salinarimonas soli]|uniref:DUF2336 domain-containing protein n=1 Tax=Salinarimonas soli TaxID=1638099 RepID=UPI001661CCF8|nr:DUF2336 domain-containing protein [Salinarimonas soli]
MKLASRFDAPLSTREAELYDTAMCELVGKVDPVVRGQLSERLARVPSGPVRSVLLLAHDPDSHVAAPVLRHSPLLPEPVLVAIAWTRGQGHLAAIAGRRHITPRVSDMVLARGAAPVLRTLAANDTARLSEDGMARLARLARGDGRIKDALARRPDVPGEVRRGLGIEAVESADPEGPLAPAAIEAASDWLTALRAAREPRESDLARCLREDETARIVALVAYLGRDELGQTAAAFRAGALDAMVLCLRMADIRWPLAERVLRRCLDPGAPVAAQQAAYQGVSPRAAERALRALRMRSSLRVVKGWPG